MHETMNCRKVKETVFLYTDNEMDGEVLISFREHVSLCPKCERYIRRMEVFLTHVRRCHRASAPDRLRRRILTSLPHRQA